MASLPPICPQPLLAKLRLKDDRVLSQRGPGMGLSSLWAWPGLPLSKGTTSPGAQPAQGSAASVPMAGCLGSEQSSSATQTFLL